MGVLVPNPRNMQNYSDGFLHFDVKTTGSAAIKVGIKSSRGGESWLPLGVDSASEFGFARDGQWHSLTIPLNRFGNIDFRTVHQLFMLAGDPAPAMNLSIDNVWWEPSVARPAPAGGNFGVYTETALHKNAGQFALGTQGNFFIWENTLVAAPQTPLEGTQSISLQSAAGQTWFGAAFTPNVKHDLSAFSPPNGKLCFALKTSANTTFLVGLKSGNIDGVGQKWITFPAGNDPYGFVRDGQWHTVQIPMSDVVPEVDLREVSQLFQVLGVNGPVSNIQLDDIYFAGINQLQTNVAAAEVLDGVGIRWPTVAGTNYTVQWASALPGHAGWSNVAPPIVGDGTTNCVFDPLNGAASARFYRVGQTP